MKLFTISLLITILAKASLGSVTKGTLIESTKAEIVATFHTQVNAENSSRKQNMDNKEAEKQIEQEAKKWSDVISLLPERSVDDDAASWIEKSIVHRATFFGPYFLKHTVSDSPDENEENNKEEISEGYLNGISKVFPSLSTNRLSQMLKQRNLRLNQINDYHKQWKRMVISFLNNRDVVHVSNYSGALGGSAQSLLWMAADPNEFQNSDKAIVFTGNFEASASLTAVLVFFVQQRLQKSYSAVYSGTDTIFSLVYYPKLVPEFDGFTSFKDVAGELKIMLSKCLYTMDGKEILDVSKLQDTLWDGEHLQIKFKSDSTNKRSHEDIVSSVPYASFTNNHKIWEKFAGTEANLYDPTKFTNPISN